MLTRRLFGPILFVVFLVAGMVAPTPAYAGDSHTTCNARYPVNVLEEVKCGLGNVSCDYDICYVRLNVEIYGTGLVEAYTNWDVDVCNGINYCSINLYQYVTRGFFGGPYYCTAGPVSAAVDLFLTCGLEIYH